MKKFYAKTFPYAENFIKDNIVNFNYILLDVNRYKEIDRIKIKRIVAALSLVYNIGK